MAIAIGSGTGEVQYDTGSSGSSRTVNKPTNAATGDLLVAVVAQGYRSVAPTASGWTNVVNVMNGYNGFGCDLLWRTHDGSASYTFSNLYTYYGSCAVVMRVTGANKTTPINGTPTSASNYATSTTPHPAPAVTTSIANTLLINAYVNANYSYTPASGQTEIVDLSSAYYCRLEVTQLAVAGTGDTGAKNSTPSSSSNYATISAAIAPGVTGRVQAGAIMG